MKQILICFYFYYLSVNLEVHKTNVHSFYKFCKHFKDETVKKKKGMDLNIKKQKKT